MPVSVVCESAANVNAAVRESLCSVGVGRHHSDTTSHAAGSLVLGSNKCLQDKLIASAKRVLFTKIEYEEVTNCRQSILDTLKSKYIVLRPTMSRNINGSNDLNNKLYSREGFVQESIQNSLRSKAFDIVTSEINCKKNPSELPQPKRVLYQRENIRIGWRSSARKWQVGVGMINVGNTCYLNSTLQALFHVPSMANWLMSDTAHMDTCDSENASCIICAMAKTLQASQTGQSAIRPYFVYSKLKSICHHLIMGRQEDAHEFLRYLVEAMEKSFLARFRNYKELDQFSKETTPLNQILGGYLKSAVICLACGHVSTTFQHFQDLLLDIRKADTIEEALDGYFSRERLEDMCYKCESCKKKVSATKQFFLERVPIALCIQLKRFSMIGTKLSKQIAIPPRLDLAKYLSKKISSEQVSYRLVAMVTHLGASQHCGHYTAIGLTESGIYYSFDDNYVRPTSVQNVINTNAYIIFYEIDTTPGRQQISTVTSAQVSGLNNCNKHLKENCTTECNSDRISMLSKTQIESARLIGPQLPSSSMINGCYSANGGLVSCSTSTTNRKLFNSRQSGVPTQSSKIVINFKNSTLESSASNIVEPCIPSTSISKIDTSATNNSKEINHFQNSANPKHLTDSLVNQENLANSTAKFNGSTTDNEVTSAQNDRNFSSSLPSMPQLNGVPKLNSVSVSTASSTTALFNGSFDKKKVKSLVPYKSESEEKECFVESALHAYNNDSTITALTTLAESITAGLPNSSSLVKPKLQSKSNAKTEEINLMFSKIENSKIINISMNALNSGVNKNSFCSSTSSLKSLEVSCDKIGDKGVCSSISVSREFKRSKSTPTTAASTNTTTTSWKKGAVQKGNSSSSIPIKKNDNPFSSNPRIENLFTSDVHHQNKIMNEKRFPGKRNQNSSVNFNCDSAIVAVNELLKHSHQGYGATVLSWDGAKSETDQKIIKESRLQRKRDWNEEHITDLDRGRQKKVKIQNCHSYNSNNSAEHNLFQELQKKQQINDRRWASHYRNGYRFNKYYNKSYKHGNFRSSNNFSSHHSVESNNFTRCKKFPNRLHQQRNYNFHRR